MQSIRELIEHYKKERERINGVIMNLEAAAAAEQGASSPGVKRKTILEMAEIVLREHGKPMHVKAMVERIQQQFDFHVKATSLGTMLYRCAVERKKTFVKENGDNNTYGLKEWVQ